MLSLAPGLSLSSARKAWPSHLYLPDGSSSVRTDPSICLQVSKILEAHPDALTLSKPLGHWVTVVVRVSITVVNAVTKATSE